jgi:hypothetical protein
MKPARAVTILLLLIIAVGHLLRLAFGVEATVGGTAIPMWVSVVGMIVPAALAYGLYREHRTP